MRLVYACAFAITFGLLVPATSSAQADEDKDRVVAGGGITVPGWRGRVDSGAKAKGASINDSKFVQQGKDLHLTIGPAAIYWNPANTAKGDYTVKATFKETKMSSDHPHPAGVFIGGNNLDTEKQTFMYCIAYGSGMFLVRQFNGDTVTTLVKRMPHDAVHKAAADGSVTNEVGWTVKGDRAECVINGTAVAGFNKSEIVGPGKLDSTDGVYGIRVSHNMDVVVSGLAATK
jgi:hypothetical protein